MPEPQSQIERMNLLESINSIPHMDMNATMAQVFNLLRQRDEFCKYNNPNINDHDFKTITECVKRVNDDIKILLKLY